ncbi:hypothetical protein BT63DRAFT_474557 [Microthyrium microscopicum]|uniref:Zn(2)-C6 fungal-type domain-containing protein n=1 Tax=Microthyrium microscopicum TaxID=703497 RepID=A0A6A6UTT6_9PEZI|nr:hypothetical protein BT63DRAFT_474557 [Microthyrium microscopicum]
MSKFVAQEGVSKRPKRASRACDHCRWKRLKCSDEQKDQSCMNCVIYGVKCLYTPPFSPGGSRKRGESSSVIGKTSSGGITKKRGPSSKDRSSHSPGLLESGQDSPTSSYADEVVMNGQSMLPKFANARRLASEYAKAANPTVDMEQLSHRLDQFAAFLTGFSENQNSPVEILSEESGLPAQPIANALLQAYTEGFNAGALSTTARWRPPHLSANARRARSMHEFTPPPTSDQHHLPTMGMDPLTAAAAAHHHLTPSTSSPHQTHQNHQAHQNHQVQQNHQAHHQHQHQMSFNDPSGAMSGLGIDPSSGHPDYALTMHHGHPQAVPSNVRGALGDERPPRSVPHGLTLAIPGAQQQWAPGGPSSAPAGGGMHLPQGYGNDQGHGAFY